MNITVENLAPCKKLLRVELDVNAVNQAFELATKRVQQAASLPGFRPGKVPRDMVLKRYEKEIVEEVRRKLIPDTYRKAMEQEKLQAVTSPDFEEIQLGRDQELKFAATVETAPEFELPEYKGMKVTKEKKTVTEEDVTRAIDLLRTREGTFEIVDRPLQDGDFAVINYKGTSEGKPLTEFAPTARGLTEKQGFWVEIKKESFIPGFSEQLVGAKAGDKKSVEIDFPEDFVAAQLSGRKGTFEVEVIEVRERKLPELNEAFAQKLGAQDVEKLKDGVRADLVNELKYSQTKSVRGQIARELLAKVQFELPESVVQHETRNVVYDIVRENQSRGITREMIEQQKDAIYSSAAESAKERVKVAFLVGKIAQTEKISVSREDLLYRIQVMAQMYNMPVDKFINDLKKRDGINEIHDQILSERVFDFLEKNAVVEEVEPAQPVSA